MVTPELIHYLSAGIALCFSALGGGIGQGIAGSGVLQVLNRQPTGNKDNFKVVIIGLALIESGIILALVMSMTLIFSGWTTLTFGTAYSVLGIGLAIGLSAATISISSSFVVKAASEAISRQPFFSQKIITLMLLSQSIIETTIIFTNPSTVSNTNLTNITQFTKLISTINHHRAALKSVCNDL